MICRLITYTIFYLQYTCCAHTIIASPTTTIHFCSFAQFQHFHPKVPPFKVSSNSTSPTSETSSHRAFHCPYPLRPRRKHEEQDNMAPEESNRHSCGKITHRPIIIDVPAELLESICKYLDFGDIKRWAYVNRHFLFHLYPISM